MSGAFCSDDAKRLAALEMLKSEDAIRDEILKKFTQLGSELLGITGSFVSILDNDNQYIKAAWRTSFQNAFCRHTLALDAVLVCSDTRLDARFSQHPLTIGEAFIRFYAGAPLRNRDGMLIGTLCVTDVTPPSFFRRQNCPAWTVSRAGHGLSGCVVHHRLSGRGDAVA